MRIYAEDKEIAGVICNKCGKKLLVERGIVKEGCFHVDSVFGYFSKKDGMRHQFDLCEACYDEMTENFQIPLTEKEDTELL